MKNKDPYKRLTKLINDLNYEVTYGIGGRAGPFTIAWARLYSDTKTIIVGWGTSRCSVKDKQNDAIGNQVAIGKAMTAALLKVCGEKDLHLYSVLMG